MPRSTEIVDAVVVRERPDLSRIRGLNTSAAARRYADFEVLDAVGVDWLAEQILDGLRLSEIPSELGVTLANLTAWLAQDPSRSARIEEARRLGATLLADLAEKTLLGAPGSKEELTRAAKLADHYRWLAAKASPELYGERVRQDVTLPTIEQIDKTLGVMLENFLAR